MKNRLACALTALVVAALFTSSASAQCPTCPLGVAQSRVLARQRAAQTSSVAAEVHTASSTVSTSSTRSGSRLGSRLANRPRLFNGPIFGKGLFHRRG